MVCSTQATAHGLMAALAYFGFSLYNVRKGRHVCPSLFMSMVAPNKLAVRHQLQIYPGVIVIYLTDKANISMLNNMSNLD